MSDSPIYVLPDTGGGWVVKLATQPEPLSRHATQTEAERTAVRQAVERGSDRVLIRDCYQRTRQARIPRAAA
jgi:hypothetical protein